MRKNYTAGTCRIYQALLGEGKKYKFCIVETIMYCILQSLQSMVLDLLSANAADLLKLGS